MFTRPCGELTVIMGSLTGSGIVELIAQSQYGIRKIVAAASYVLRCTAG